MHGHGRGNQSERQAKRTFFRCEEKGFRLTQKIQTTRTSKHATEYNKASENSIGELVLELCVDLLFSAVYAHTLLHSSNRTHELTLSLSFSLLLFVYTFAPFSWFLFVDIHMFFCSLTENGKTLKFKEFSFILNSHPNQRKEEKERRLFVSMPEYFRKQNYECVSDIVFENHDQYV